MGNLVAAAAEQEPRTKDRKFKTSPWQKPLRAARGERMRSVSARAGGYRGGKFAPEESMSATGGYLPLFI